MCCATFQVHRRRLIDYKEWSIFVGGLHLDEEMPKCLGNSVFGEANFLEAALSLH